MGVNLETSTAEGSTIASGLIIEWCKADSSKSLQSSRCSEVIDDAKGLWEVGDNWEVPSQVSRWIKINSVESIVAHLSS